MEITKVFKPEVSRCPLCKSKLMYRYTVSNKVIQFYNGSRVRVKNLGYSCTNQSCLDNTVIYTSQTASKMCIKGYTYSAKVIAYIALLKLNHLSREAVCNKLALNGIEISDRNIDIIFEKYKKILEMDYKNNIRVAYEEMKSRYGQIRISIDSIVLNDIRVISIRESFKNHQLGIHFINKNNIDEIVNLLKEYVNDPALSSITTVRRITQFFKLVEKAVERKMDYLYFEKI